MTVLPKTVKTIGIGILGLTVVIWALTRYEKVREAEVAVEIANEFFQRRSAEFRNFDGPVVVERANAERMFKWRSAGGRPVFQLEVSPLGGIMCFYEVIDEKHFLPLECSDI